MMMDALTAGGLESAFDPDREKLNDKYGDENYKPNPNGFYELSRKEYKDDFFPLPFEGKLVKCLMGGLTGFPVNEYKTVFMRRNREEIRQSFEAFFQPKDKGADRMRYFMENKFEALTSKALALLRNRKDTEVTEIWYRDVVRHPLQVFEYTQSKGFPIDPVAAANTVDPSLCRFKEEKLVKGL